MGEIRSTYRYLNSYLEVFSCFFVHGFYRNGICSELSVQPTASCKTMLRNHGLVFKPKNGGFSLAANSSKDYSNRVFRNPFHLNFEFKFTNPYFLSFTALNSDPEVRYFLKDDFTDVSLFDGSSETDIATLDRPDVSGIINIIHDESKPIIPIDGFEPEVYTPRKKVYHMKPRNINPVYICYTDESSFEYFRGLTIEIFGEFKDIVSFAPPVEVETYNGYKAYQFVSKTAIPMKDSWKGYFRLNRDSQLGSYGKILPNPIPKTIKYNLTNNSYISENYVKL